VKRAARRTKKPRQDLAVEDSWAEEDEQPQAEATDDASETGWAASTAGLSGLTRLARAGAWVLVASGPLLGLAALLGSSGSVQGAVKPAPAPVQASGTGPAGFAQLYVAAYLEAGEGTEKSLIPYYSGSVALTVQPGTRTAARSAVIATKQVQPGYWSVTVAADVTVKDNKGTSTDAGVQYYRVGVEATGPADAGGTAKSGNAPTAYAATSLPAQVAAPSSLKPDGLAYPSARGASTADPAVDTASGFLTAYLTGTGELDRYTSPGVHLQAVDPAPYAGVKVADVQDDSTSSAPQTVPDDGTVRHQLVTLDATDRGGRTASLTYALALKARAGRWEVTSVDDAPALQAGGAPPAASTSTADPGTETTTPSPSHS
jgi:hypothetical protein